MLFEERVSKNLQSIEVYGCAQHIVPNSSCSIEWLVEVKQPMVELGESNHVLRCSVETPIIRSLFGAVYINPHDLRYVKYVHQIPSVKTDDGLSRNVPGSIRNASFLPHTQDTDVFIFLAQSDTLFLEDTF